MEKIDIIRLEKNKKKKAYLINYILSTKELFDKLQIDKNDGSNDIITAISEKVKKHLSEDFNNSTDTWKITNNEDLINLKFLLELKED